ncbi:MAG: hypothetical protein HN613_01015 [Gammaproteobacteria bacterium]|jgi:hypothetical protein|nr:hypothetical protein [Gammaproteobacteria bacterium]MBT7603109.1 hypothetical protein [Gammaproteobacteria bacterium]
MFEWILYTIFFFLVAGSIAGVEEKNLCRFKFDSKLKPKENPKDNARMYLAYVFFADAQSCYVNYNAYGLEEVLFGFAASMIGFGPLAYGLGYLIRKNNLPK